MRITSLPAPRPRTSSPAPGLALALGLAGAALAACSPYEPDLGVTPYLCAQTEPRCPEGFGCSTDGMGRQVCVLTGELPPDGAPDASPYDGCAPDGQLEPNDTIAQAFQTDIGTGAPSRRYGPISICPEGDKDLYQVNLTSPNQGIEVITRWESGSAVASELLNRAGTPIANGTAMGLRALRACVPNLPVDRYYARASAATNVKNNYRIDIRIVAACN